ncbi:MAG: ABC transporter permease [Caldilinea sp.]|nr:ABC transporter permease [Caldilinea sp.]MCB0068672.1 ABC transporter permease [Caldilineaceae bacterium]MCB0038394.1 ABC transporter permease [Caldilinea sp.]MCB9113728.1 ABC transporter permease [Caldilineaceae bacterium]MCB9122998.1 ABC transporter permease [Caldilineaceae bacterium]
MTTTAQTQTPSAKSASAAETAKVLSRPSRSFWRDAWSRLLHNKAAVAGALVILFFMFVAIFAPLLAPHNPLELNSGKGFLPPMWVENSSTGKAGTPEFILGTDNLGRDVLSRVIYGARVSMVVGFIPTLIIVVVGVSLGMISGYFGGSTDNLLMRLTDIVYAFPDLLFFIIVMTALRATALGQFLNGLFLLFVALALVNWVGVARLVRGQVLSLKEKDFVLASRAVGAKDTRIMIRHILPNSLGVIIVAMAFLIPGAIITEAILGYLGLGLRPSTDPTDIFITSWGSMLLEGQTAINNQPWILLAPAIAVALVVLSFNFLGDGLRDALDPRLRE